MEPKDEIFKLKLSVPQRVSYRDGGINFKVSITFLSEYAFAYSKMISGLLEVTVDDSVVKLEEISSTSSFQKTEYIDFLDDLRINVLDNRKTYSLNVTFTDEVTKKNFSASSKFTVEMSEFNIQILNSARFFKTGLPYVFQLIVTNSADNVPVLNSAEPIYAAVKNDKNESLLNEEYQLDPLTGSVQIELSKIPEGTEFLQIFARYDQIEYFHKVEKARTKSSESIAINVLTPCPKMKQNLEFELITTNQSVPFAVFQLFSKGELKTSLTVPLSDGYGEFSIVPKFSYTPTSFCIAYIITEDGELVSDAISVQFENELPNHVRMDITFDYF